tara:strand:+ start:156 stop:377 length:222 start_codon:yes stop_codon:yes gene_type:complete
MFINIEQAFENSYRVVMGEKPEDFILREEGLFIHNPERPLELQTLFDLLEYFEGTEEYEKCNLIKQKIELFND